MPSLGAPELLIILVIVLLIFGGSRLRDVMKSLGTGVREFRESASGDKEQPPQTQQSQSDTSETPKA